MMNSPATNRAGLRAGRRGAKRKFSARARERLRRLFVATRGVFEIGALFALAMVIKTPRARDGGRNNAYVSNKICIAINKI